MKNLLKFLQSKIALSIVVLVILLSNVFLYNLSEQKSFSAIQKREDASGFSMKYAYKFAYFYYYTNTFPLASLNTDLDYSVEGARNEIINNGEQLIMEFKHWSRLGENARIFAFLPNAWLNGSAANPSIKLFNTVFFVSALLILYLGFWLCKRPTIGLVLLVLINTTPFFLYEVYSNENIFGLMGSLFFMILGINAFVLFDKKAPSPYFYLTAILSSFLIAFSSEIRNEISILIVSLLLIYSLATTIRPKHKIGLLIIILGVFIGSKKGIREYFNFKFEQATTLVKMNNGHVYTGERIAGHKFWHPVFCGLGDFDTKYAYAWNDTIAYEYAVPILNERYQMDIKYSGKYHTDNYYDDAKLYYVKFDEIPEYEIICKEKVMHDIINDPIWYISILLKRISRTLTATIPIPYFGWLIIPLFAYLIKRKDWQKIRLLLISLPLSAGCILIHSGLGSTYNSVFVYMTIAVLLLLSLEYFERKKSKF